MKTEAVTPQKVVALIGNGISQKEIARRYNLSVYRVSRMKQQAIIQRKKGRRCTCCGVRPVARGNRFLCNECFSREGARSSYFDGSSNVAMV